MNRHLCLSLLLVLIGIAMSTHGDAQPTPTAAPVIREIAFRGIEHFSIALSDQLAKVIKSHVGEPYNLEAVIADKHALIELGWFAAAESVTVPVEGGIRLIFQVVENVPVVGVKNQGLAHATADQQRQADILLIPLAGQPFNKKMSEAVITGLLAQGIFYNITYKKELVEGGIRLTYLITENPTLTAVGFTGIEPLTEEQLRKAIASQPGGLLNQTQVSSDAAAIRKVYADEGYNLAQVTGLNISPDGKLVYTIFVPKISEIRITGNEKTPEAVIRAQLTFKVGDYYHENAIRASLDKIRKLPLIKEVSALPTPGKENGTLCVTIQVKE